jgi:hypothetical protein
MPGAVQATRNRGLHGGEEGGGEVLGCLKISGGFKVSRAVKSRSEESQSYRRDFDDEVYDGLMDCLGIGRMSNCTHIYRVEEYRKTNGDFVKVVRVYTCVKCGARSTVSWTEHV